MINLNHVLKFIPILSNIGQTILFFLLIKNLNENSITIAASYAKILLFSTLIQLADFGTVSRNYAHAIKREAGTKSYLTLNIFCAGLLILLIISSSILLVVNLFTSADFNILFIASIVSIIQYSHRYWAENLDAQDKIIWRSGIQIICLVPMLFFLFIFPVNDLFSALTLYLLFHFLAFMLMAVTSNNIYWKLRHIYFKIWKSSLNFQILNIISGAFEPFIRLIISISVSENLFVISELINAVNTKMRMLFMTILKFQNKRIALRGSEYYEIVNRASILSLIFYFALTVLATMMVLNFILLIDFSASQIQLYSTLGSLLLVSNLAAAATYNYNIVNIKLIENMMFFVISYILIGFMYLFTKPDELYEFYEILIISFVASSVYLLFRARLKLVDAVIIFLSGSIIGIAAKFLISYSPVN